MHDLKIIGLPRGEILAKLKAEFYPGFDKLNHKARQLVGPQSKREVWLEQAAAMAFLCAQYNDTPDVEFLEIGACQGYSAAIMALAAPNAIVTTLEPHGGRRARVRAAVHPLGITVRPEQSKVFLGYCEEEQKRYDVIFVDGDHKNIKDDLPYWNLLKEDGLFLHHDYSPEGSKRGCRSVWEALNDFSDRLGHPPDVLVQDDGMVGLAGWYRRDVRQVWPPEGGVDDD